MATVKISHAGRQSVAEVAAGANLLKVLQDADVSASFPCNGNHTCGKCRVIVSGAVSPMDEQERLLLGAAALFFGVWRVTQSLLREASEPTEVIEDWLNDAWGDDTWADDWYDWDDSDGPYYDDALENNWMMQVEGDDGEDMILMLSFDGEDVCLFVVTGAHTDYRGKYAYEYEGADAIYIPEFAQSFHYYVRDRGRRLILEPGIVLGGEYEEWTLAD